MQLSYVPFEKIDKRKWNGTVYASPNGNISGYYWFLKSVLKEWDALIEGDYQSVMPVFRYKPSDFQMDMLYELGPYTVNAQTTSRLQSFYQGWSDQSGMFSYPFNSVMTRLILEKNEDSVHAANRTFMDLSETYEQISGRYLPETNEILHNIKLTDYTFHAQEKPEQIIMEEKLAEENKHILHRLMYNAIQRGCGWHARVSHQNLRKNAAAFYISDHRSIRMLYSLQQNDKTCLALLHDTFLKGNAGRPIRLYLPIDHKPSGGESSEKVAVHVGKVGKNTPLTTPGKIFSRSFWHKFFK